MLPQVPPPEPASDFGIESRPWRGGMSLAEIVAAGTPLDLDISEDMEREFQPQRQVTNMANQTVNQLMGSQIGSLNQQNMQAVKETPFTQLAGAVERLRKAHAHVLGVAGKLCGETPTEGKDQASRATGSGMFGGIEELADSITDMAGEIMDHAERINRRI